MSRKPMSLPGKIALGAATLLPLIYLPVFVLTMLALLFSPVWTPDADFFDSHAAGSLMFAVAAAHLLVAAVTAAATVYYFYHLVTNDRLSEQKRLTWALLIISSGLLALPVYYYSEIWRERPAAR